MPPSPKKPFYVIDRVEEDAIEAGAEDYQIIDPQEKVFRDISAKSRGT